VGGGKTPKKNKKKKKKKKKINITRDPIIQRVQKRGVLRKMKVK
jgi:hypothetical protein